jgi:hypothetical protein
MTVAAPAAQRRAVSLTGDHHFLSMRPDQQINKEPSHPGDAKAEVYALPRSIGWIQLASAAFFFVVILIALLLLFN